MRSNAVRSKQQNEFSVATGVALELYEERSRDGSKEH